MGFYVNVKAKQGCAKQINELWEQKFGGFLIYTPKIIRNEIEYIKNDPSQSHLLYVKDIPIWNKTFPIMANGRGQVFIRPFGYSEERSKKFIEENQKFIEQINFILDHRLLFKSITSLQDAVDALDMNINCDYIENGKMKNYEQPTFSTLPQKNKHPVFQLCLEINSPELWQRYLDISENGFNNENWNFIRGYSPTKSFGENGTIWQRCESLASARDNRDYGLEGRYNKDNYPSEFDLMKSITCSDDEFKMYLECVKKAFSKNEETTNLNNVVKLKVA